MNTVKTEVEFIEIASIEYHGSYKLLITFNDGKEQIVDFEPFLQKSQHPEIRKYLDIERFKKYTLEYGHLHWNDYDLSFSIDDLYSGQIL